jgi:hypothetical protein
MPHALNLTIPIKQDEATKKKLAEIEKDFATKIQPKIDAALRKSKIVHFARVLNVHGSISRSSPSTTAITRPIRSFSAKSCRTYLPRCSPSPRVLRHSAI